MKKYPKQRYTDSFTVAYIAAAGHEGVPGCVRAGEAIEGGAVCLLCLSSGMLGNWTVREELLGHGCSISFVCNGKFKIV